MLHLFHAFPQLPLSIYLRGQSNLQPTFVIFTFVIKIQCDLFGNPGIEGTHI